MNAKKSMRLRRLAVVLILSRIVMPALLLTPISSLLTVTEVEAQTCSPAGRNLAFGPIHWNYNWIANGTPSSDSCWSHSFRASFVTGTTECGPFTPPTNAWEFFYGGEISQSFTISGENMQAPVFPLGYEVDFVDPNDSVGIDSAWKSAIKQPAQCWPATSLWALWATFSAPFGNTRGLATSQVTPSWFVSLDRVPITIRTSASATFRCIRLLTRP